MVDIALYFLRFTQEESCGKCAPCRIGTRQMAEILARITAGEGSLEDLQKLEELALTVKQGSLCGLGQTAPNPVLSTLRYFRDEYLAHIVDRACPARVCKNLITYLHRPREMRRLSALPEEAVPIERHHRGTEEGPRHRPGRLHQVRGLFQRLPGQDPGRHRNTRERRAGPCEAGPRSRRTHDPHHRRPRRSPSKAVPRSSKSPGPTGSSSRRSATIPALEPYAACRLCLVEVKGRRGFAPGLQHGRRGRPGRPSRRRPSSRPCGGASSSSSWPNIPTPVSICAEKPSCDDLQVDDPEDGRGHGLRPLPGQRTVRAPARGRGRWASTSSPSPAIAAPARSAGTTRSSTGTTASASSAAAASGSASEVRGASVLTFVSRGSGTVIGTALDRRLLDSGCQFCGACVDACPTGSLAGAGVALRPPGRDRDEASSARSADRAAVLIVGLAGRPDHGDLARPGRAASIAARPASEAGSSSRPAVHHPRRAAQAAHPRERLAPGSRPGTRPWRSPRRGWPAFGPGEVAVAASAQSSCEDLFVLHKFAAERPQGAGRGRPLDRFRGRRRCARSAGPPAGRSP